MRSAIPLKETLPWSGAGAHPVDITISLSEVPTELANPVHREPVTQVGVDGSYLVDLKGVARYLVRGGDTVLVDPALPPDSADVRLFLQTNCLSALATQRGLLALHGAVVRVGDKTIAILAPSGHGKSTLAATLALRGHWFLAEDVCVLDAAKADHPIVMPTLPNIRLWADALKLLGIDRTPLERSRRGLDKFILVRRDRFHSQPSPLDMIVRLHPVSPPLAPAGLRRARGVGAVGRLPQFLLRPKLAGVMGLQNQLIETALKLVQAGRVYDFGVPNDRSAVPSIADEIERLVEDPDR